MLWYYLLILIGISFKKVGFKTKIILIELKLHSKKEISKKNLVFRDEINQNNNEIWQSIF